MSRERLGAANEIEPQASSAGLVPDSLMPFCRAPQRFLLDLAQAHGPVAHFRLGDEPFVLLSEPAAVHSVLNGSPAEFEKGELYAIPRTTTADGLLTIDGAQWADQHALLAPLFAARRMRTLSAGIAQRANRLIDAWAQLPKDAGIDMFAATKRLAFDVVGQHLLGITDKALAAALFAELSEIDRTESVRLYYLAKRLGSNGGFERSPLRTATERLERLTYVVADARLARASQPDDFIGTVMASSDFAALAPARKRLFLRDLIATMLSAGYMTTGESLFWALYCLARHPEAQERARAELRAATEGFTPDAPPWLAAVCSESMRLYPPVWFLGRIAKLPTEISGEHVPTGTRIICSPLVLHHMAELWPDPEAFRPERFLRGANAAIVPRSFIPFGTGMRACIGRGLALMEMSVVLSMLLTRFDVQLVSDDAPLSLTAAYSMQPRERVLFRLRARP